MDGEYLPPVVVEIVVNDATAVAKVGEFKVALASTASGVSTSTGNIGKDLEGIGVGAATGVASTERAMSGVGNAVSNAVKDVEAKSSGFASRMGSLFESVGNAMGSFGIPFGNSVKKMGYSINEGEQAGKGFSASLKSLAKVAAGAGLLLAAGIGVAAIKAADTFDVAQKRL